MLDRTQLATLRQKLANQPLPPHKHVISLDELEWAFTQYKDETQYMSVTRLSKVLGCSSSGLHVRLRNVYGEVIDEIGKRRGLGGPTKRA